MNTNKYKKRIFIKEKMIISKQQGLDYITETLGVQKFEDKYRSNKLELLQEIILKLHHFLPFQNVNLLSGDPNVRKRNVTSLEDNVKNMLSGIGGLSWCNNSAVYLLLKALGYCVYPVLAKVVLLNQTTHMLIIVKSLKYWGDTFLIDIGFGYPCFQPIPLDVDQDTHETRSYIHSFLKYKYAQHGDKFVRMHRISPNNKEKFAVFKKGWGHAYVFKLEAVSLTYIQQRMEITVYRNPDNIFNNSLRMLRWTDGKMVAINGKRLVLEDDHGQLRQYSINDIDIMMKFCHQYFKELDTNSILHAVNNLKITF